MAHDVFICHSAKNKVTADAVCAVLENRGIRCWIAPRDVTPGLEWGECIIDAIEEARVMVLVFTSEANESPQIRKEVERAVNRGLIILPLRLEDILPSRALEYFIGNVHWLDALTPPLESHLQNLASTIQLLLTRSQPHSTNGPAPHAPSEPERPRVGVTREIAEERSGPAAAAEHGPERRTTAILEESIPVPAVPSACAEVKPASAVPAAPEVMSLGWRYVTAYLLIAVALAAGGVFMLLAPERSLDPLRGSVVLYFLYLKVAGGALIGTAVSIAASRRARAIGAVVGSATFGAMTVAEGVFFAADFTVVRADLRRLLWLVALLIILGLERQRRGGAVRWLAKARYTLGAVVIAYVAFRCWLSAGFIHANPHAIPNPGDYWLEQDYLEAMWWGGGIAYTIMPAIIVACLCTFVRQWRRIAGIALGGMVLLFVPVLYLYVLYWQGISEARALLGALILTWLYEVGLAGSALLLSLDVPSASGDTKQAM